MGRKIIRFCAALMLLGGIGVFFYPAASKYHAEYKSRKAMEEFQTEIDEISAAESQVFDTEDQETDGYSRESDEYSQKTDGYGPESDEYSQETDGYTRESGGYSQVSGLRLEELYRDLQAYNERLYQEGQSSLQDPFDYESPSFDLTRYGFSQNIIGTLWVPRMEIELPVYLGANSETMAKGAGLLGQTSMPLGGENTNVVLAAHRGWKGIPMFRSIQSLQLGDKIQLTTPWETLVYRVCELKIILPGDSDEILIQQGRDLITLLTCHPYTQNYQRYLVVAERSMEEPAAREEDLEEAEETYADKPRIVEMIRADGTSEQLAVDPSGIQPAAGEGSEAGAEYSNIQIWLEDYGVWIGFGIIILLIAFMFLQGRGERKGKNRRKDKNKRS